MSWNIMEYHGISWNIMEYHGISWNIMEYHGISWNIMEYVAKRRVNYVFLVGSRGAWHLVLWSCLPFLNRHCIV